MSVYLDFPIEIKEINCLVTQLYSPDGKLIGDIVNEYQMDDIRIQIAELDLSGYYFIWKKSETEEVKIDIDNLGKLSDFPSGLWDFSMQAFAKLVKIRRSRKWLILGDRIWMRF